MAPTDQQNRELTLSPDTYLYLMSELKSGQITVYRGPASVNQTGQDKPVKYDPIKRQYQQCSLEQAVQQCPRASEGDYVILENPTEDGTFIEASSAPSKVLKKGRKIVIPGPWSEALWAGQNAIVIEGHKLRSNQYLVVQIYNDEEAKKNWASTVAKPVDHSLNKLEGSNPEQTPPQLQQKGPEQPAIKVAGLPLPDSFSVGTRIVICGDQVSFYIPCTGVEVVKDEDGRFVREAVTLEQLEYACLVDENGKKEYPRGPKVVFPKPTQVFEKDSKSRRKFQPIELNTINGIHLKVTADFSGPNIESEKSEQRDYKEGTELFVTGKTLAIYYPREELAIIEYGAGNKKHYSTAIPKGEGRYVINRITGDIKLVKGPRMFLADPRTEIPVRRVVDLDSCELWYPGNKEALAYNADLEQAMAESPSGRSGTVSEGDYRKRQMKQMRGGGGQESYLMAAQASGGTYESVYVPEEVSDETTVMGDSIKRGTKFTQPRTLTLNTKYDGVPKIEVWPGFTVLIVGAEGSRRVEVGPNVVLLEYDEKLGFMELSTGKPKSTDKLMRTAYLCVQNNQVGDIVGFESKDHVKGKIKISLRVSFEADTEDDRLKWFGTDNYVKFLTDHVRSIIAGTAKKFSIAQIRSDYVTIVRDAILGVKKDGDEKRPGLPFENGMKVTEAEVLELKLDDPTIAQMLDKAQTDVVRANIEIQQAQQDLEATREKERIKQDKSRATYQTTKVSLELSEEQVKAQLELALVTLESDLKKIEEQRKLEDANESLADLAAQRELIRNKATAEFDLKNKTDEQELKLVMLTAETKAATDRMLSAKDGLYEIMTSLGREDMIARITQAVNLERHVTGEDFGSSIANILSIIPSLQAFSERAKEVGSNRLKSKASQS